MIHVVKTYAIDHPVDWEWFMTFMLVPPIKMVMTGGWFMTLFYSHYSYSPQQL